MIIHSEELHNVYYSPNITTAVKLRSIRLAGYVAHMRYNIVIKLIIKKQGVMVWTRINWLRMWSTGNDPLDPI
jgi:hypothetical protein